MHRIIHLPLSCWTDVLTYDEEEEGGGKAKGKGKAKAGGSKDL